MGYALPGDVDQRPVAVVGAGTLGRRIAAVFAAGGTDVQIFDPSGEQLAAARDYAEQHLSEMRTALGLRDAPTGGVATFDELGEAVRGAWMVIEAVPELVDLKRRVFGELDRLADGDAILASNSSSLPTRLLVDDVEHRERVLNTHFYQPPELNAVELMSCGATDEALIDALMERFPQYGLAPFRVRRESDGFIFNRCGRPSSGSACWSSPRASPPRRTSTGCGRSSAGRGSRPSG